MHEHHLESARVSHAGGQSRLRRAALAWCLCSAGVWASAASVSPAAAAPATVAVGGPLGEATMQGLNGPPRKLSSFRGRPLIINVWASWCAPCRAEMASLERLAWGERGSQFAIIGISTDDYPERAQLLLKRTNATISHYIDQRLQLETMLGATHLPLTVLVDAQGRVVSKVMGAKEWDGPEAGRLIDDAFGKARSAPRSP